MNLQGPTLPCHQLSDCISRAEEGDLRLIEEAPISNWMTGRLQVFFEGSWSQVCAGLFDPADANVACRQLGYGAGTVVPQFLSDAEFAALASTPVFPEVAITGSGCNGTEQSLLDCGPDLDYLGSFFNRDCLNSGGAGLVLGCVGTPAEGTLRFQFPFLSAAPSFLKLGGLPAT